MHVMAGDHTNVSNINILLTLFLDFVAVSQLESLYRRPVGDVITSRQAGSEAHSHNFTPLFCFSCQLIPQKGQNNDLVPL